MKNRNLSIEDFNNLLYALIKQEEVVADQKFDGHMYSDTENKITIGIGFNIEAEGILPIICARKMNLLISSSESNEYILKEILNDPTDVEVVNKVAGCISSVIKDFHTNNKIRANDKQNLALISSRVTQEDIDYINKSIQTTSSSNARKQDKQQSVKQNIKNNDEHLRALQLEKAVNKKISDTIKQINNSKQYTKQYALFELILTQEDAKEIFIFLSRTFHKELINSLLAGKNGLKVFHGEQLKEYSKLIISFLCGHYQMPAKFNKYKDPTDFFHNAIYKNNSRFLSWFGIRYYIDLVSASKNNQYNNYIKRRLHEAAIFELVERKEDGTIDIYQTSKDIFTYLNIIFKFIKVQDNVPLAGYDNKTFLEFIKTHSYSNLIDKVATNQKNNISFSELDEYSAVFKNVTKIQDLKNCLQNNISIDENKYFQSILDFATYDDIFKPFVLYINEKFSKDILNIDFKLNEIYVVANTNLNEFQSSIKKYFNETTTEVKNILLISQSNWGLQQRFENVLDESKQNNIILYLLKNREHVIAMNSITQNNFRILLYDDNESINAIALLGKYILINDDNDEKLLYQHEENKEIHAEYIPNENIFIIMYQETKISLRNFFPSKFHAGIVLSNQEEIKEDPTAVSQVGEINIKIELKIDEMININELDKKNYYLFNTKTNELIDGIIEVCGDNASVCFKINADPEDISNTKLIFSLNKEDFSNKKEANIKSHDTTVVDKATRDSKQTTTKASVTQKDIKGIITGVELVEPTKENLPDINSYMETIYKFRATTSGVLNTDYIKWSYAVLTNKDYYGLLSVKDKHKPLSFTGEEISFKPSDILNDEEKELLSNNSVKLCVFAYMKSPALYVKSRKTHSVCSIKRTIQLEEKLSEHFSISELVNTSYEEYLEANKDYAMEEENYLKLKRLCTDILEPIRTHINGGNSAGKKYIIITSGVRCKLLNDKVKGSTTSQHMACEAVDFVLAEKTRSEQKNKLVNLFEDIYNKKVCNLDINNIYQCIIERNSRGSYWLHIGLKTQERQDKETTFTIMVEKQSGSGFTKQSYHPGFFTDQKF